MFLGLSFVFSILAVAVFAKKGKGSILKHIVLLALMGVAILSAIEIGLSLITGEGVNDSVFYHMTTGLGGGDISQYAIPAAGSVVVLALLGFVMIKARRRLVGAENKSLIWNAGIFLAAMSSLVIHPVTTSTVDYALRFSMAEQYQEGFYVPEVTIAEGTEPKNLILLYLESVERTYFDQDRFPDLLPNLKQLEAQSTSFTDMTQTMGAGFTIGGMVASQCGTPLILSGGANSMRVNQFLSGAECMGDILSDAGYETAYLGGASVEFAGKGAFYKSHGYETVEGLDELLPTLEDPEYIAEWGIQDDTLFDLARAKISDLSKGDQPFALSMLTLDTHHPNGHAETNKVCRDQPYGDGSNPMLNSVKCADILTANFVSDIQNSDIADETLIVVMSDHLAMGNTASEMLEAGPRRNMFFIIDPSKTDAQKISRASTTLDVAPTLLSALGLSVDRMGFGVDLQGSEPTLPEYLDIAADNQKELNQHLLGFQSVYDQLWAYPDITDGLYTNLEKGEVQFGANAYGLPALLTFDEEFGVTQATLGDNRAEETLTEAVIDLEAQSRLLWFDDCRALEVLSPERVKLKNADLCVAHGKRGMGLEVEALDRSGFKSTEELMALLNPEGDEFLASFEQARLEEIGVNRGELPFNLSFQGLETGDKGVLIQSSAFGAGPSFIRRQTTTSLNAGEDWAQKRGITLTGLSSNGRVEVISNIDQCAKGFDLAAVENWKALIEGTRTDFVAHLVTVHDTAFCGNAKSIFEGPLADLPLKELKTSEMRQAYIGVIDNRGRIFEFPNRDFPKLRVFLDPVEGSLPEFATLDVTPTAVEASPEPQLQQPVVAPKVLAVATADGCKSPVIQAAVPVSSVLNAGQSYAGSALASAMSFGEGWWPAENAGRWAGAANSQVELILPDTDTQQDVDFVLAMFGKDERQIDVSYNGRNLASHGFKGQKRITVDVTSLPKNTPITLDLVTTGDPSCPAVIGTGSDPRRLNFFMKSVSLKTGAAVQAEAPVQAVAAQPILASAPVQASTCVAPKTLAFDDTAKTEMTFAGATPISDLDEAQRIAFGSGWWPAEKYGRWVGGSSAEIELILPETKSNLRLEIATAAYSKRYANVGVRFDGKMISNVSTGLGLPLTADVSALPRGKPLQIELVMLDQDASCPAMDGSAKDDRFLRLMVQSIGLFEEQPAIFGGAIAHGAGRVNGEAISNSFDALQANLTDFDVFEIDFNWTDDGELVCIHDWNESLANRFGDQDAKLSHAGFVQALSESPNRPRNCDIDGLAGWMRANPDKKIVTDIKTDPMKGHAIIAARHPDILDQFVPQAYQPSEIESLKAMGFSDVIWTLYRFERNEQKIVQQALVQKPAAITMPQDWAIEGVMETVLANTDLPVLVHTINNAHTAGCLKSLGASGVYSDDIGSKEFSAMVPSASACS